MRAIHRKIGYASRADVFRVVIIADVHLGNVHTDERLLRRLATEIASEPNTYWIGLGDYVECINIRDPRFDPLELVDWLMGGEQLKNIARAEAKRFIEIMQPTAHKCLGLCEGNHEWAVLQHSETDVYSMIVEGLHDKRNEHRLDHSGFVTWSMRRRNSTTWMLRIFASHGSQGGRRMGSTALRLEDLAGQIDGVDVIMQGHAHKAAHIPIAKRRVGRYGIETATVHCISAPAMCKDMAYAERKDMPAVPVGYTELLVQPDKERIDVRINVA